MATSNPFINLNLKDHKTRDGRIIKVQSAEWSMHELKTRQQAGEPNFASADEAHRWLQKRAYRDLSAEVGEKRYAPYLRRAELHAAGYLDGETRPGLLENMQALDEQVLGVWVDLGAWDWSAEQVGRELGRKPHPQTGWGVIERSIARLSRKRDERLIGDDASRRARKGARR